MNDQKKDYLVNTVFFFFSMAILLMLVSGFLGGWIGYQKGKSFCDVSTNDTIIIDHWDTAYLASPPDTVTNTITKVVKVSVHDTATNTFGDSVQVELPFDQHLAHLEDVADVWYSGYQAKIDSAKIYRHDVVKIVEQQVYVQEEIKSNYIGVEAGFNDASVMYMRRLGTLSIGFSAGTTYKELSPTARAVIGFNF